MTNKLLGLTGPSGFSNSCFKMIEQHFKTNFVPLPHENLDNLKYWLERCDGFVVAGGLDIHPSIYGKNVSNKHNLSKFDIQRDIRELMVIDHCLEKEKPMLGICRGHQLIAIALGLGSDFIMDLSDCTTVHQPNQRNGISASEYNVMHSVNISDGNLKIENIKERSFLEEILGETNTKRIWVNSFHHQGILYLDDKRHYDEKDITVLGIANAEMDKKRHIIELMRGKTWLSTQWHPEYDYEVNTPSRTVLNLFGEILNHDDNKHLNK